MKKIIIHFILFFGCLNSFCQEISLVIENKIPGQLSTSISNTDRSTVENLKISGVLNHKDLQFIGTLMRNNNLHGIIDLEDAVVFDKDNVMNSMNNNSWSGIAKHIKLPINLEKAVNCFDGVTSVDTVTMGGPSMPVINGNSLYSWQDYANHRLKTVVIRDGAHTIDDYAFSSNTPDTKSLLSEVVLPASIKKIGDAAFRNCINLKDINLNNNIEVIGGAAFKGVSIFKDTLYLPKKLETYSSYSFVDSDDKPYNNQVVYIPNSVKEISVNDKFYKTNNICAIWHIDNEIPPTITSGFSEDYISSITIYVPKNSIGTYKSHKWWQYANIIAEPRPIQLLTLNRREIRMKKGEMDYLQATITPTDADDKSLLWTSSDASIVTVSQTGEIHGLQSGTAKIIVSAVADESIKDSCIVTVFQPVSSVKINSSSAQLNVGETLLLRADINPNDADNKKVIWTSSDESIIKVDCEGNVSAIQSGDARIIATSEDNKDANDYCIIKVLQPLNGITLDKSSITMSSLGQTEQLNVNYVPENASNKEIKWTSSNESVCLVSNGTIVAVGYGTSVIIATSSDGGYLAICTVTVEDTTGIEGITNDKDSNVQYFDSAGRPLSSPGKGITIIKRKDGSKEKLLIK